MTRECDAAVGAAYPVKSPQSGREELTMTAPGLTRLFSSAMIVAAGLASASLVGTAVAAYSGYDGSYHGDVTMTRGDQVTCGKPTYQVTYTVVNGHFDMMYDPAHHVGVNLEVAADGSFSGNQTYMATGGRSTTQLKAWGRIAGNVLEADIEGMACARHYHLTKTG
jgi:hypothetical protein